MTNEEIQKHIEQNCRNVHGEPMMDEQAFYEGAKWMRNQVLRTHDVLGRSEQLCGNLDKNFNCKNMCLTHCIDGNKFWK